MDRRTLLKVIGTSTAAAAVSGCSSGATGSSQKLIPYLIPVEELTPGVSAEFSTVCRECPAGCGMIARVRDGRAHKVEGNPDHPVNRGTLCIRGQSSLQGLYNPDRHQEPLIRGDYGRLQTATWADAERRLDAALRTGGEVAWIGHLETGARDRLVDQWLAAVAPTHTRLRYEPFAYEPLRTAAQVVTGHAEIPDFRIAEAHTIFCFGAEFLETWVSNVEYARAFSQWRQARVAGKHQGRYVFIGPRLSLTAANADEWIPVRPGTEAAVAAALAQAVEAQRGGSTGASPSETGDVPADIIRRLAREFAAGPASLALPPGISGHAPGADSAAEAVMRLNRAAGALGTTVLTGRPHALSAVSRYADVVDLISRMRSGAVRVLFLHHVNPAYDLPPSLGFAEAVAHVPVVISFSSYPDETALLAHVVMPDHTPLESWGEYSPRPGITGLMQPVVSPVFDTRNTADVLLASARRLGHDLGAPDFRAYLQKAHGLDGATWARALERGGIFTVEAQGLTAGDRERTVTATAAVEPQDAPMPSSPRSALAAPAGASPFASPAGAAPAPSSQVPAGGFALILYPSLHLYDGRLANRPWAQEIPDPMGKVAWNSWAEIHPDAAGRLRVRDGDVLNLATEHGKLDVPARVTERVHPEVVAVQLGQGHTAFGRYAANTGANPLVLLGPAPDSTSGARVTAGIPVTVTRTPVHRGLAVMQTSERQVGPEVAREISLVELARKAGEPENEKHREERENPSLYRYEPPGEHHWGMAIDLDRCIGCNACVAACYAENNVPIVGRDECTRGREMAWLRIENYRPSQPPSPRPPVAPSPRLVFLPMLCQQCNNAPCEYVCPVNATVHSREGLNQQVYNRCVGTRFCSNNCPYKVRRFNWFAPEFPTPLDQQLNPDVIERSKGVMEKCTFCVQRIRRGKIDAGAKNRPLRDGEIMTACQQTCPTDAIVFGDLNDPESRVRMLADDHRGYSALGDLNTYPNVTYLSRVRAEAES